MRVEKIRELIKDLKDYDEVAVYGDGELWECIAYITRSHGVTCLVLERE